MPSDLVLAASDPRDGIDPPYRLDRPGLFLGLAAPRSVLLVVGQSTPDDLDGLAAAAGIRGLRMAADRHLFLDGDGDAATLEAAVAGRALSVHDVSDAWSTITVDGRLANELIAAGSAADLSLATFPVGSATQTELGRLRAVVIRRAGDGFDVLVDTPALGFAWGWACATATLVAAAASRE